jgi:hypothetical protein
MKQDTRNRKEVAQATAPVGNSADPALAALVRCLARIAAERDYAAYGGPKPPADCESEDEA